MDLTPSRQGPAQASVMPARRAAQMFALSLGLLLVAPAAAYAARQVSVVPAAGAAGTTVTVRGGGFPASAMTRVKMTGRAPRSLRTSSAGRFAARLTVPHGARGSIRIVSRSGTKRVVDRFLITRRGEPRDVMEVASSGGAHLRLSPTTLAPGGVLHLRGRRFGRRKRIRLSIAGATRSLRADFTGRFATTLRVPTKRKAGIASGTVVGPYVRLHFAVVLSASATRPHRPSPMPSVPSPSPSPSAPPNAPAGTHPSGSPSALPANTALPTISGRARAGHSLTADPGTWRGRGRISYAFAWERCDAAGTGCAPLAGATGSTYAVVTADVGSRLRVAVTATDDAGAATARSSPTAVVQSDVVALWHMDELSGTTMNDAIGAHRGTLIGNVKLGLPGFAGTSYGFDGASTSVRVPSAGDLNPGSAGFRITIHMQTTARPPSTVQDWDLIRKGTAANSTEIKMEYYPSAQASCGFVGKAGSTQITAGPRLDDGAWHTVQCVKTASSVALNVDGRFSSRGVAVGSISNSAPILIGTHPNLAEFFNGALDEASIAID